MRTLARLAALWLCVCAAGCGAAPGHGTGGSHHRVGAALDVRPAGAATSDGAAPRALVVVVGQPRGGELAWTSLRKHVLEPLHADLATYFTDDWQGTLIQRMSRYRWSVPEPADWGDMVDQAAASCGVSRVRWSALCDQPHVLGGVQVCGCADAACPWQVIPLMYRWLALQKIEALRLHQRYDWFVLTRSDELHLCDHPPLSELDGSHLWLPEGEHYGGWSDRHFVAAAPVFVQAINVTLPILCNPEEWRQKFKEAGGIINIERVQAQAWREHGLQVKEFPRTMLTVRAAHDPSRWAAGEDNPALAGHGLKVKYSEELAPAERTCGTTAGTHLAALQRWHDAANI